jgi:hypothetical protein
VFEDIVGISTASEDGVPIEDLLGSNGTLGEVNAERGAFFPALKAPARGRRCSEGSERGSDLSEEVRNPSESAIDGDV